MTLKRTDVFSREKRSEVPRIRGKNTRPEVQLLRKALFALELRYRIHRTNISGRPDIAFPGRRAVVFVNGCFRHGHGGHLFKWPKGNAEFWRKKISRNIERDVAVQWELAALGWRSLTVWECAIRKANDARVATLAIRVRRWPAVAAFPPASPA